MICRFRTTGVSPLSSASSTARRARVQIRCSQISNSAAHDYSSLDKTELKKELKTRGLSISGGREQLIHRLHLSDLPDAEELATQDALPPTVAAAEIENKEEEQAAAPVKKTRVVRKKKTSTDSVPSPPAAIVAEHVDQPVDVLNEVALLKLAKGELQAMAAARGVAKSGTKAQIAARIMEVEQLGGGAAVLAAAVTVVTALNSKRRVLAMMEKVISVAVTTTAAQNVKWAQQDQAKKQKKDDEKIRIVEEEEEAKVVSERRVLSPDEAAKVLEEVVRRKGTGGVGLGTGDKKNIDDNNSGGGGGAADLVAVSGSIKQSEVASEVDSMKTVMAGLKERLNTQEENTEQLRVAIQSTLETTTATAPAVAAAVQVEQEKEEKLVEQVVVVVEKKKNVVSMVNKQDKTPVPAPDVSDNVQATIDFALTLGKAISVVGRELFNSFMKKNQ